MSDVSGIPNLGIPGMGGGQAPIANNAANLAANQAAMQQQQNYYAQQAALGAQQQALYNSLYGPQGFGGQTAQYAAAGAAYGRGTGYYGDTSGLPPGEAPKPNDPSVFDTGAHTSYDPNAPFGGGYVGASSTMGTNSGNFNTSGYFNANPDALDIYKNQGAWGYNDPTQFAEAHLLAAHNNPAENGAWRSGWAPTANTDFNTQGYYDANPDALAAFAGSGSQDPTAFAEQHLKAAYNNPADHSMRTGWGTDNPNFDAAGYYMSNPDAWQAFAGSSATDPTAFAEQHLKAAYNNPADRSIRGGWGADNSDFNAAGYYQANPDAWQAFVGSNTADPTAFAEQHLKAAYNNPADRSTRTGWETINPDFDVAGYYKTNPDAWQAYVQGGWGANADDPTAFAQTHLAAAHAQEGDGSTYRGGWLTNSDPGFDTAGWFGAHPDQYKGYFDANNQYTNPTAYAIMASGGDDELDMSNFQSPTNDYSTFQKGPTYDWQSSMLNGRNDPRVINAVYRAAGETKLPPAVIAAVLNMESRWNPADHLDTQYGLPQMSANMWGDRPFNGLMGGVDFNTFKNDPVGDKQIGAYTDWLIRGGKLNRDGIDVASVDDPVMQAAMLQAIQFGGNSSGWRTALAGGDQNQYITTAHPQAPELRPGNEAYPTINSMYNAFDKILGGWRR